MHNPDILNLQRVLLYFSFSSYLITPTNEILPRNLVTVTDY